MFKKMLNSMILLVIIVFCLSSCGTKTNTADKIDVPDTKIDSSVEKQPEQAKSESKLIEPCSLISKEEAEKLINKTVEEPKKTENKVVGQKICFYDSEGDGTTNFLQISLSQDAFMSKSMLDSGQNSKTIFEAIKNNFENHVKIDGIGDDAFIAPPEIHILKDSYYITIGVGNSDDARNREILKEAGKKAVENLEKH